MKSDPGRRGRYFVTICLLLFLPAILAPAAPGRCQASAPATAPVEVTVTAVGPHGATPPKLLRDEIVPRVDNQPRPVLAWVPAQEAEARLELAVVVDESLDPSLGLQFGDLGKFLRSLPGNALVEIAYASNGSARMAQGFTTNHEAAVKALRPPMGLLGGYSGIYFALTELIDRWPEPAGGRREVLLLSHGIDLTYGIDGSRPFANLGLDRAIRAAQRRNVVVSSIYTSGAGRLARNQYLVLNGQSCLGELALETGGVSYTQGFATPISFRPYLEDLAKLIGQQYLLTFRAALSKQAGYHAFRVVSERSRVELLAPARVYLPAAK
jgi:hypothetical protein